MLDDPGKPDSRGYGCYLGAASAVMFAIGWYMLKQARVAYFISDTPSNAQRITLAVVCFLGSVASLAYALFELLRKR